MKTNPFAGLMAGFRGARAEDDKPAEDEARKARRAEEDQRREEEDARRAEEDDQRREEDARRAEEDGKQPEGHRAEDEDQDPEADADDDDDADAEDGMGDDEKKAHRRGLALGRARENARATRIFTSEAAHGRPDLAATLAFTTRNSSAEAIRVMGSAGAPAGGGSRLHTRMSRVVTPNPGASAGGKKPEEQSFGEMAAAAAKKAGIFR